MLIFMMNIFNYLQLNLLKSIKSMMLKQNLVFKMKLVIQDMENVIIITLLVIIFIITTSFWKHFYSEK